MQRKKDTLDNSSARPLLLPFPKLITKPFYLKPPSKIKTTEFYTISDGWKKTYTIEDCMENAGEQNIKDVSEVSLINLFINGVLQPKVNYEVRMGKIILKTVDAPAKGSPIILQMITV
ncbi:DUF4183 domain-containing protein [Rummeliibacillus suwonensis]|uniref:DUF4183 domain-containing protein n=1 Tax=Rummeliibacillus suwonensis TaxID=1306154 RepID=UPI0011B40DA2|nr:DUF4183 domain-containing protein [Rummeliibacillus suwonensis]